MLLGGPGLVRSQRGRFGGHTLAMEPGDISLSSVMESLGPSENLVPCLNDPKACIHVPACAQREVWQEVELAVDRILSSRTIGDLVDRSHAILAGASAGARPVDFANTQN